MKIILKNLYKVSDTYMEVGMINDTSYTLPKYEQVNLSKRKVQGKLENTLLLLESKSSYIIETNLTQEYKQINISPVLYQMGLLISPMFLDGDTYRILVYNTTLNTIYLKKDIIIGEV